MQLFFSNSTIAMTSKGINFIEILTGVLKKFGDAIPGIVGALLVFIVGWIIAQLVSKVTKKFLARTGVDKFADKINEIDFVSKMRVEIKISKVVSNLVYYLILLITMMVAAEVSGMQELSDLMEKVLTFAPKALSAVIIMIFGLFLGDLAKQAIVTASDSVGVPSGRIIGVFVFYFIFIMVLITALNQLGIPTDMLSNNITIIIAGIVLAFSVGYGFASRQVMSSLLSSFFYTKGKVKLGDVIRIGDVKGQVVDLDSTSLTVKTDSGSKVLIPLSRFTEEDVEIFE